MSGIVPFENLQQVFDKAWNGMKAQGWKRATGWTGIGCEYKTKDGLKCAIGHVVPEEFVAHGSDGSCDVAGRVTGLILRYSEWSDLFANLNIIDLQALQECHDHYFIKPNDEEGIAGVYDVEAAFRKYAEKYSLTIPDEAIS
jgi:hypothetical protein